MPITRGTRHAYRRGDVERPPAAKRRRGWASERQGNEPVIPLTLRRSAPGPRAGAVRPSAGHGLLRAAPSASRDGSHLRV